MADARTDALLALARKRAAQPCGVETTLSVLEGRWKLLILFQLLDGTRRFSALKRQLSGVTRQRRQPSRLRWCQGALKD